MKNKKKGGKTVARLMKYIAGTYKFQFTVVCAAIIISALANMAGPLFLMILIDDFITPLVQTGSSDFTAMWTAVLGMAAFYLIGVACTYIYNRLMVNIGQGVQKRIRDEMFTKMQSLPVGFFDTHSHGEIMSVYTNDIDTLRQLISQSIPQLFSSVVTAATLFAVMAALSWQLSIISIIMVAVMIVISLILGGKSNTHFIRQQEDLSKVNGYIEEMIGGQKVIKVFNHEAEAVDGFKKLNDSLGISAAKANKYANAVMPCIANVGNFQFVLTAIVGGAAFVSGFWGLTLGKLVSYIQFTRSFNQPFSQISQQFNSMSMALAGAKRIFALMDEQPESDDGTITLVDITTDDGRITESDRRTGKWAWKSVKDGRVSYTPLLGEVRFNDVDFGYTPKKRVLKNISLTAEAGQKIAFVGSTGAGKTTITNLINRFYDIQNGAILYDGIDVRQIKKPDLRKSLGIVLQDTVLFSGTVIDNIRYSRSQASDEEVYAAAKLANADDFIRRLPQGYLTEITDNGQELSQGQRQLLSIARAALADCPVLILDEATSSIDTHTEALVQDGMDKLMHGRTVFVIAHRLSTIRNSDSIEVLEDGRIIEQGSHRDLIGQKGSYYRLYTGAQELD